MNLNAAASRFRTQLVELVNASGLPAVCLRHELEPVLQQLRTIEQADIAQEQEAEKSQETEDSKCLSITKPDTPAQK